MTSDIRFIVARTMRRLLEDGKKAQARKVIEDSDLPDSIKISLKHELAKRSLSVMNSSESQPVTKIFRVSVRDSD